MPKNSFLSALFQGPKFSVAPIEHNNRGSVKIGQIIPVFSTILNPREGIQLDLGHLVRFMPAKAPVMEGYKVTFDAFAVPYSCLGYAERKERDIDDFFNLKENAGLHENPFCFPMFPSLGNSRSLGNILTYQYDEDNEQKRASLAEMFRKGSLCDYIDFPSLKAVRDHVRKWLALNPLAYGNGIDDYVEPDSDDEPTSIGLRVSRFVAQAFFNDPSAVQALGGCHAQLDFTGRAGGLVDIYIGVPFCTAKVPRITKVNDEISSDLTGMIFTNNQDDHTSFGVNAVVGVKSLLGYILENYPAVAAYYGKTDDEYQVTSLATHLYYLEDIGQPLNYDYLQVLYDNYEIDAQSIFDEWFEYVMSKLLYKSNILNADSATLYESPSENEVPFLPILSKDEPVDLSYLAAYWKIISDWYINTNIDGDPERFFIRHCCLLHDNDDDSTWLTGRYLVTKPFTRRWGNDIFTSSVPMASVQNVRIPADGTIPDLREANAYQKLVDIFRNTGNRLRDVIYGVFGITPSAVRSEMSEPIGSLSSWIGMQSVLQTSQTTPESPQAAYSGIGTDSSGHSRILKYVNNAEPTPVIIMVLMSVTQRASYFQGFDRKFFRKSIYDFAVPQLAMIGEQEVTSKELYFDKEADHITFGFNRRYYDWFYQRSECHGEMRDTLDYWHGARMFDEQPYLNAEFIGIESDIDHLQRIFANTSESAQNIVYNLSFDGYKTVALPRYIQYEL